jgi:hypothetical protein
METPRTSPDDPEATLAAAEQSRARLVADIALPAGYETAMGIAIAVQIAAAAVGLTVDEAWAGPLVLLGVAVFVGVAAVQLARFRALNGVWLGGFASHVVLGTAAAASVAYAAALFGALAAASQEQWWLIGLLSIAGAVGYVASGRRWMDRYRGDPATHGPGETIMWLLSITALAVSGYVLLVING